MSLLELEAEALKLPETERALLAKRLLESLGTADDSADDDDPIWGLGSAPVSCNAPDASVELDKYLYGSV